MKEAPRTLRLRFFGFALVLGLFLILPATVASTSTTQCATVRDSVAIGKSVRVDAGSAQAHQRALAAAIQQWARCPGYGQAFPSFVTDAEGFRTVQIDFRDQSHGSVCGEFSRNTITVYAWAFNALGRRVHCAPPSTTLTHELGHVLGLLDAPREARCESFIMAADNLYGPAREIDSSECAQVAAHWKAAD